MITCVYAVYAVHNNMRGQMGGISSLGLGAVQTRSLKQKINAKSSTETELVGVSEMLPHNIWIANFMSAQGYPLENNF